MTHNCPSRGKPCSKPVSRQDTVDTCTCFESPSLDILACGAGARTCLLSYLVRFCNFRYIENRWQLADNREWRAVRDWQVESAVKARSRYRCSCRITRPTPTTRRRPPATPLPTALHRRRAGPRSHDVGSCGLRRPTRNGRPAAAYRPAGGPPPAPLSTTQPPPQLQAPSRPVKHRLHRTRLSTRSFCFVWITCISSSVLRNIILNLTYN